ncbi:MAG TPA: hypothetical protein VHL58_07235 [Thermoanaerobaculia bacterium]|nr:hypothetical protein [Thermoanaerobaculia bacterium]
MTDASGTLIDQWLATFDFVERHKISIDASRAKIYDSIRHLAFHRVAIIRVLFALRSLPGLFRGQEKRLALTIDNLQRNGFMILEERQDEELVIGVVGKFWKPSGQIRRIPVWEFKTFEEPGFAKAVWNFRIEEEQGRMILSTETRIRCLDGEARRKFAPYWFVIQPFSGLIRMAMLHVIKREAERDEE